MPKPFTVDRRRLTIVLAIAAPIAIGLGILQGELQWRQQPAIALPEICIEAHPDGDVELSQGNCQAAPISEL